MNSRGFIACGMYAFNRELQAAWQDLFDHFQRILATGDELESGLVFETGASVMRDPRLFIGHTCGYPLMNHLQDAVTPFCVPLFDLPGTDGKLYSSCFVVPANSGIEGLADCRGQVVALNNEDSNSGMNVLRHALAGIGAKADYFQQVLLTGGHHYSMQAVAAGEAQLAAIDCISYQLNIEQSPELSSGIRTIGYSEKTCGLPLVLPARHYTPARADEYLQALNLALRQIAEENRKRLHLNGFAAVDVDDYRSILALEEFAVNAGYAELK